MLCVIYESPRNRIDLYNTLGSYVIRKIRRNILESSGSTLVTTITTKISIEQSIDNIVDYNPRFLFSLFELNPSI
jgi:hypothetical protein